MYLNGSLVSEQDAAVSVFDHGIMTGDGVFETVLVHRSRTFALRRHLDRLERSAAVLGLDLGPGLRDELERAAEAVVRGSRLGHAKLRITLTSGPGPLGSARGDCPPTVIVAIAAIDHPDSSPAPAEVALAPWPRNEHGALAGAKTISYAENAVALAWARAQGATEAVFANTAGNLCEGTGSNVFVEHGGALLTPPVSAGCLAGVTRALVLESGVASEADLAVSALGEVKEAFLCSTTRGVQPIARIDGRELQCPGPLTMAAAASYDDLLDAGPEP